MKELLTEMIKAIVDKPDEVDITITESENTRIYELRLGDGDVGKVIGKKGRNVSAIRTILSANSAKEGGKRSILEIIE
ncbi:KH domain-containing protein [Candidatus Marinimicrobia bacterium PRS2]|jgi:predicted RNA-binding protein YlqC (UPF0109 family)|nr:KH domain-containing protein [Candidatus Marinimicrobia bacterium PRS2]